MSPVRRGTARDAATIAHRVAEQLRRDATLEPLVSPTFARPEFEAALAATTSPYWVDDASGRVRGHLYGVTLDDALHGRQTWTGPDGYSFDHEDVLDELCPPAYRSWREDGSTAHLVWALAGGGTQVWVERGYALVSVRAAITLATPLTYSWPSGFHLRRGDVSDLPTALAFDALIDRAQGTSPEALTASQREAATADLIEMLDDPDCRYYLLEDGGRGVAQCITFPLPTLRGNYDATLYVGSLAVDPAYQRRGLATSLIRAVLSDARADGLEYAEVRWHIDNPAAAALWASLGFRPTYVQLRRRLDD